MRVARTAAWVLLASCVLVPAAASEGGLSVTPAYLRLSSARDYPMEVRVDADWSCDWMAPQPDPVSLSVQPAKYGEELGPVFRIEPANMMIPWNSTTASGLPRYTIHTVIPATVSRVGQPFEDRQFSGQWWAKGVRLGTDCTVTDDERNANRAHAWQDFQLDVPVIEDTLEPANTPAPIPFALLLALAVVAVRVRTLR